MKSERVLKCMIAAGIGLMMLCFAAGMKTSVKIDPYEKRYVFICPLIWNNVAAGIRQADQEFAVNTKLMGSEELNVERQADAIRESILTGVDGMITAATGESQTLTDAVNEAVEAEIPVVMIDGDLEDSMRSCYIGTDNLEAGRMAGRDMYEVTGGTAKIAAIVSTLEAPNQKERLEGFQEEIMQYPGMEILTIEECHSKKFEIREKVTSLLRDHSEIDALYITEAIASDLVGNLLKEEGIAPDAIHVVAFDRMDNSIAFLRQGIYDAVVSQQPYQQGYQAVKILTEINTGKKPEEKNYTESCNITVADDEKDQTWQYGDLEWHLY